jgi:hypothetical protein
MLSLFSRSHFSGKLIARRAVPVAGFVLVLASLVSSLTFAQADDASSDAALSGSSDLSSEALANDTGPLPGNDPSASALIARARARHHDGRMLATLTTVRESFLTGRDTLRGEWESGRVVGERRLALRGVDDAFEWWSRTDGGEQWRREGERGQLRRLPPHSRKKPSFTPDVSYDDLARLPYGYFEGYRSVRRMSETDSTVLLNLVPGGTLAALYSSLDVTLGRADGLPRRISFNGVGGRPSKTLVVSRYHAAPGGVFPAELVFASADGLSRTILRFTPLNSEPAKDKVDAPPRGAAGVGSPRFAEPRWEPRDRSRE